MRDKKRLYMILGVAAAVAVAVGCYLWNGGQAPQNAQVDGGNVTSVEDAKEPKPVEEPQVKEEKPAEVQRSIPAEDVVAMTFEGTKTYIVAGSVTGTRNGNQWTATLRNGTAGKLVKVEFKQEGKKILTRNEGGSWRTLDEMDQSIFRKVQEIVAKQ